MTAQRESRAALTSKYGFSVVAPMSVSSPLSTAGRRASCCALLKRWISSRNRSFRAPFAPSRSRARCSTPRTSSTRAERPTSPRTRLPWLGDDARERCLPDAGWRRTGSSRVTGRPRSRAAALSRAEDVTLPDQLVERPRAHALWQRRCLMLTRVRRICEEVAHRREYAPWHVTGDLGAAAQLSPPRPLSSPLLSTSISPPLASSSSSPRLNIIANISLSSLLSSSSSWSLLV